MSALKHGLPRGGACLNNARMARQPHVYGWDEEPADERPSEFAPSTGYSLLSGYHVPADLSARSARRRRGRSVGAVTLLVVCVVLLAVSGAAMVHLVRLLHG